MAQVSFRESAIRHWNDSRTLAASGEVANVGQLLGFSAECGLKALYRYFLLPPSPDGNIEWKSLSKADYNRYHKHIDVLCSTVSVLANSPTTAKYASMIPSIANFTTWHTDQRYWSDAEHVATCKARLPGWEAAVNEVLGVLDEARKDGMAL